MGLLAANGIILRILSEALTPVERINALPKIQRRPLIHVICVIVFLGSVMFVDCVSGTPNQTIDKKTGQALNDLSSCLRFCKQSICANRLVLLGGERFKEVPAFLISD